MSEPAPPIESLRERTRKAVFWGVGLSFFTKAGTFFLSLALMRLLSPEIYGQYAAVNAVIMFLMAFSMAQFSDGLLFEKTLTFEDYHRQLGFGLILHAILFVIANLIAVAMSLTKELAPLQPYVHLTSFAILLNVPRIYYGVHLRYHMNWKQLRALTVTGFLLNAAASVAIALAGGGILALLAQNFLVPLPYVIALLWADRRLLGVRFDLMAHKRVLSYGLNRTAANAMNTGYPWIESLVFSFTVGLAAYGLFNRAKGIATLLAGWLSETMSVIAFPALAKIDPKTPAARRSAAMMIRVSLWLAVPCAAAGAVAPGPLIDLLCGPQWEAAIPLTRPLLAAAVGGTVWTAGATVVLTNEGASRALRLDGLITAAYVLCVLVLPFAGLMGFVMLFSVVNVVLAAGMLCLLALRGIVAKPDLVRILLPCIGALVLAAALTAWPACQAVVRSHVILGLLLVGAVLATVQLVGARLFDPKGLSALCDLLPARWLTRRLMLLPA